MKSIIKADRTHAYVGIAVLVAIFMGLFIAVMHGQDLPNAPQAAIKHHIPPVYQQWPQLAKPAASAAPSTAAAPSPQAQRGWLAMRATIRFTSLLSWGVRVPVQVVRL